MDAAGAQKPFQAAPYASEHSSQNPFMAGDRPYGLFPQYRAG
jgi:hypothetical protein